MRRAVMVWLSLVASFPAWADPLDPKDVPTPLKPWVPWALHGAEQQTCPRVATEAEGHACAWPSRLSLEVTARGGRFRQDVEVFARDLVLLPGDGEHWPLDVRDGRGPIAVVPLGGRPAVLLGPGAHALSGSFAWDSAPAALGIPETAALIALQLDGRRVARPELDESGRLFLRRPDRAAGEAERVEVQVQRRLTDGVPFLLSTRVVLDVSGRAREVLLGRALPDGFTPLRLDSPLAARLEADGRLRVQVRPGKWVLMLVARKETPVQSLTLPAPGGPWTEGAEIWVFDPAPPIRVVTLEGLASIDPSQTQLPTEWMSLATYAAKPGDTLKLVEQRRGNADPEPDQLRLDRHLWLDVDGGGWTVRDSIQGGISRSWRLEMPAPTVLGRASVNGREQPLTRLGTAAAPGVEVRQGPLTLVADSRLPSGGAFPAVSWAHDFTRAGAVVHLPPGWKLVGANGVDEVKGTWLQRWSLLDLFLVLVLSLAAAKLHGWRVGALAFLALVLTFPEPDGPRWVWVAVLAAEALARVAPPGRLRVAMRIARLAAFGVLAIALVAFAVDHLRENLYPILGGPAVVPRQDTGEVDVLDRRVPEAPVASPQAEADEEAAPPESKAATPPPAAEQVKRPGRLKKDAPAREKVESLEGLVGSVVGGVVGGKAATTVTRSSAVAEVDRQAVVQTGPGIPAWRWQDVPLRWSGPVLQNQTVRLWLFSPWVNRVLAFLRVGLLAVLALWLLVGSGTWTPPRLGRLRGAVAALLALVLAGPARADGDDEPSDERLEKLRSLLLEAPRCAPDCASAGRGLLEVEPGAIRLRLEIEASAPRVAVPLAGRRRGMDSGAGRRRRATGPSAAAHPGHDLAGPDPRRAHGGALWGAPRRRHRAGPARTGPPPPRGACPRLEGGRGARGRSARIDAPAESHRAVRRRRGAPARRASAFRPGGAHLAAGAHLGGGDGGDAPVASRERDGPPGSPAGGGVGPHRGRPGLQGRGGGEPPARRGELRLAKHAVPGSGAGADRPAQRFLGGAVVAGHRPDVARHAVRDSAGASVGRGSPSQLAAMAGRIGAHPGHPTGGHRRGHAHPGPGDDGGAPRRAVDRDDAPGDAPDHPWRPARLPAPRRRGGDAGDGERRAAAGAAGGRAAAVLAGAAAHPGGGRPGASSAASRPSSDPRRSTWAPPV